ncbi:hypothetical protein GALMADRAFT_1049221 [Galerina marginata CBS 339.88]|uniref:Uncharacterized protein n=1 Tax=Galerina marginata (strain CBS 339.88) TaxID=685588 RepID=A0A067SE22_GALM3|nr:hypothetical protein GALMADRAFT_1049221 [Galerina marginata CBS 339.88]
MFEEYAIAQLKTYYSEPQLLSLIAIIGCHSAELDGWWRGHGIHRLFKIDQRVRYIDQNGLGCLPKESETYGLLDPRSYLNFLESFLNDSARAGVCVLDGQKYASAGLYVLHYTCLVFGKQHQLVKVATHRHLPAFKILPWKWHRRRLWTRVLFKRWEKRPKRDWWSHPGPNLCKPSKLHSWVQSLRENEYGVAFKFGLECLPPVLSRAGRSEELIAFSRRCSFGPLSVVFPTETKAARQAIARYLIRMRVDEV